MRWGNGNEQPSLRPWTAASGPRPNGSIVPPPPVCVTPSFICVFPVTQSFHIMSTHTTGFCGCKTDAVHCRGVDIMVLVKPGPNCAAIATNGARHGIVSHVTMVALGWAAEPTSFAGVW